jgi:hypothetical protein
MSNQIVISSGAKVRDLNGVLTGTSGIVSSVPLGAANGVATLDSGGKVPVSQLPSSVVTYLGTWNAATNTPTLVNGTGDAGDMYICNVAGTVNFGAGPVTFAVGDWVLYGSGTWQKSNGQNGTVTSVAVTESGDALTITGSPITTAGTINIGFAGTSGQYVNGAGGLTTFPSLTGFVPYTGATSNVDLGTYGLKAGLITTEGGYNFKILASGTPFENGYSVISSVAGNVSITQAISAGNLKAFTFDFSAWATNTSYTYNLPDVSGTLALTSNLSAYVPYTGATTDVNLGARNLSSYGINVNGDGTNGGALNLKMYNSLTLGGVGYLSIYAQTDNYFALAWNFIGGVKQAIFSNASIPINTTRYYNLPNADGTLALTSDLSAYLPLTGGTLTGALNGTTATFSGTVSSIVTSGGTSFRVVNSVNSKAWSLVPSTNGAESDLWLYYGGTGTGTKVSFVNNGNVLIGSTTDSGELLQVNGTSKFTGALSGTTGSFASSGGSNTFDINHSSGSGIALNITKGGNGEGLYINKTSGTGNAATIIGTLNATTLVKSGGTSSQYLMADGSTSTLTNPVTGTGTTNYLPKFTGTSTIGNSNLVTDASGNLGLGVTPSAWSGINSLQIGSQSAAFAGDINTTYSLINTYYSSGWKYVGTGYAARFDIDKSVSSVFKWFTAPSGTAGNAITFTQAMTLGSNSGLSIGTTTAAAANGLLVAGAATFSSSVGINGGDFRYRPNGDVTNSPALVFKDAGNSALDICAEVIGDANAASRPIAFRVSSVANGRYEAMRITSTGNVGIGTTTDAGYKLDVNGTGRFSGILYGTNGFQLSGKWIAYTAANVNYYYSGGTSFVVTNSTGSADLLTIANTGAATFSSSVIANSYIRTLDRFYAGDGTQADPSIRFWNSATGLYAPSSETLGFVTNTTEKMRITSGGEVYIAGTTDQGAYNLQVNGTGVWGAGAYVNGSDFKLKENIIDLDNSLELIAKMKPVTYNYKESYSKDNSTQTGFIAQDLQELLKDKSYVDGIVKQGPEYMSVAYQNLIPLLVKSIQEQQQQIEELKELIKNK